MISSAFLINVSWFLTIALEAVIVFVMIRRNLLSTFPFFFSYIAAMLSRDIVLAFIKYPTKLYARIYWYGEVVTIFLALAVIFETVKQLFPPYPFLKLALKLARATGAIAALAAVLMMVLTDVRSGNNRAYNLVILAERSVKFVEVSWLIIVITLIAHCGGSWRRYSVYIVAGFGVHATLTLAFFELRAHLQLISFSTFALGISIAYNLAAMVWAFFFCRPSQSYPAERLPDDNLVEWNDAVLAYTQQWYRR